jgi:hypothetical protein
VLAVQRGRVVVAVLDPEQDCLSCGRPLFDHRCPACHAAGVVSPTGRGLT